MQLPSLQLHSLLTDFEMLVLNLSWLFHFQLLFEAVNINQINFVNSAGIAGDLHGIKQCLHRMHSAESKILVAQNNELFSIRYTDTNNWDPYV